MAFVRTDVNPNPQLSVETFGLMLRAAASGCSGGGGGVPVVIYGPGSFGGDI